MGQRKREVTVRCTYTDGGAEAKDLVQGSFRAFLARELNRELMYLEIEGAERYRAALYIRLSREDETDGPSESVSNQRAMLEDFARQRGVPVAGLYVDDGWSGTSFDRPEFRRMLRDIEAG